MTALQTFLATVLLVTWLAISLVLLITAVQRFICDRRREKREENRERREKKQALRDLAYHEKRMKAMDR